MQQSGGVAGAEPVWSQPGLPQLVWDWFSKLSIEERVQALAVEDPLWIRLYLLLFKQELKCRKKDRTGFFAVKRERVTRLYQRLNRREASAARGVTVAPSHDEADLDVADAGEEFVNGDESKRRAVPSGGSSKRAAAGGGEEGEMELEEEGEDEDYAGEDEDDERFLAEMGSVEGTAMDGETASRRAGDVLQRQVRLCSVSSPLDTLLLLLGDRRLHDPEVLHRLLSTATKGAFLSRPMAAATLKAMAAGGAAAGTTTSSNSSSGVAQLGLVEAPWMQKRPSSEVYPLPHLLVNRLEVALWLAFWRRGAHRGAGSASSSSSSMASRALAVPVLHGLRDKASRLLAFAAKLEPARQLALLEGLRAAQKLLLGAAQQQQQQQQQADKKANGRTAAASSQGTAQVMESLLFVPLLWAYKDEGRAACRVLERVQTACADCVADELLADEEEETTRGQQRQGASSGEAGDAVGTRKAKKSKKKRRRSAAADHQQQQPEEREAGGGLPQPSSEPVGGEEEQARDSSSEAALETREQAGPPPPGRKGGAPDDDDDSSRENSGECVGSKTMTTTAAEAVSSAAVRDDDDDDEAPPLVEGRRDAQQQQRGPPGESGPQQQQQGEQHRSQQQASAETTTGADEGAAAGRQQEGASGGSPDHKPRRTGHAPAPPLLSPASTLTAQVLGRAESKSSHASSPPSGPAPSDGSVEALVESRGWSGTGRCSLARTGEEEGDEEDEDEDGGNSSSSSSTGRGRRSGLAGLAPSCEAGPLPPAKAAPQAVPPMVDSRSSSTESKKASKARGSRRPQHKAGKEAVRSALGLVLGRVDDAIERSEAAAQDKKLLARVSAGSSKEGGGGGGVAACSSTCCSSGGGGAKGVEFKATGDASPTSGLSPRLCPVKGPPDHHHHHHHAPQHTPAPVQHHNHHHHGPRRSRSGQRPSPPLRPSHSEVPNGGLLLMPPGGPALSPRSLSEGGGQQVLDAGSGVLLPVALQQAPLHAERGLRSEQMEKQRRLRDARDHAARAAEVRRKGGHGHGGGGGGGEGGGHGGGAGSGAGVVAVLPVEGGGGGYPCCSSSSSSLEQHARLMEFAKDMEAMRQCLTLNVEAFMAKREAQMKEQRLQRQLVVDAISALVKGLWTDARVELYGSCLTGLDLASSDVDVVVCGLPTSAAVRSRGPASHPSSPEEAHHRSSSTSSSACKLQQQDVVPPLSTPSASSSSSCAAAPAPCTPVKESAAASAGAGGGGGPCGSPRHQRCGSSSEVEQLTSGRVFFLHQLAAALEGQPWVRCMKTIDTAFIPVIKLFADPRALGAASSSGLMPIDISLEGPHHGGIASSLFIRDMIKPGGPYSQAVPLTLLLKTLMSQRGLNMPWGGGLSSYALMLMVMSVLQQFEPPDVAEANVWTIRRTVDDIRRKLGGGTSNNSNAITQQRCGSGGVASRMMLMPVAVPPPADVSRRPGSGSCSPHSSMAGGGGGPRSPSSSSSTSGAVAALSASFRLWSHFAASSSGSSSSPLAASSAAAPPPPRPPPPSVGFLLTYFLEYYGRAFNPASEGIAVHRGLGLPFPLAAQGGPLSSSPDPLTIVDPLDEAVNVSRCCFRIGEIQWILSQCLQLLELKGTEMARKATAPPPAAREHDKKKKQRQHPEAAEPAVEPPAEQQQQAAAPCCEEEAAAAAACQVNILGLIMSY